MAIIVVDVSQFQGIIDGAKFAAAGVRGAYVQAQRGNDVANPDFTEQVKTLRAAGIACGAYLYTYPLIASPAHPNRDPIGQVDLFFEASDGLGSMPGELPPMLDAEFPEIENFGQWSVSGSGVVSWHEAACEHADARWGRSVGIYTYPFWWRGLGSVGQSTVLASRALWLASYPKGGVQTAPPSGSVPSLAPWSKPTLWQFTNDFEVPGFGTTDASVFEGDEDAWQAFLGN